MRSTKLELDSDTEVNPCRLCIGSGTYETWSENAGTMIQTCYRCGGSGIVRLGQFYKKVKTTKRLEYNRSIKNAINRVLK